MLSRLLRQFLFILLHFILTLYEGFCEAYRQFRNWRRPKKSHGNELEYVIRQAKDLNRKPRHLVISFEDRWLSTNELADLTLWSLLAGIPYLSFYNAEGMPECVKEELFLQVEKRKRGVPGIIKWSQKPDINGYSKDHKPFTININFFSERDGKHKFMEFVNDLIEQKVKRGHKMDDTERSDEDYTAEELDPLINAFYKNIPDPDVVTYCGPVCMTRGLLPWQIRLSEFIPLDKCKEIDVEDFICVLRRFSKCDQRFGK